MKRSGILLFFVFLFVMSFTAMVVTVHFAATDCSEVMRNVAFVSLIMDLIVMFSAAIILVTKFK